MTRLGLIVATLALSLGAARAAPPPLPAAGTVDFGTVLHDADGRPFPFCKSYDDKTPGRCAEMADLTLGELALQALQMQEPNETGTEQAHRALLGENVYKSGKSGRAMALDSHDVDVLCTAIAKLVNARQLPALITLRAWQMLDPARVGK